MSGLSGGLTRCRGLGSYQKMRREYGPDELGTAEPIGMPASPHPWCAGSQNEISNLVLYLLTL